MNTALSQMFLTAFHEINRLTISFIENKYNIGFQNIKMQSSVKQGNELVSGKILIKTLNDLNHSKSKNLYKELETNLFSLPSKIERERYVESIVFEFKTMSDILNFEKLLTFSDEHAVNNDLEKLRTRHKKFNAIISSSNINNLDYWEEAFKDVITHMLFFADKLDAACLLHGIDFFQLQNRCRIWLTSERLLVETQGFLGGICNAERYISNIDKIENESIIKSNLHIDFDDIFINGEAKNICLEALEEADATIEGKPNNLTKGKAGIVGGVMIALKNKTPSIFKKHFTEQQLLKYFNAYLGTNYKRFDKKSRNFKLAHESTKQILKSMKS